MRTLARNLSIGLLVSSAAMTVFLWECGFAQAQVACAPDHDAFIKAMQKHGFVIVNDGIAGDTGDAEVLVNAEREWFVLVMFPEPNPKGKSALLQPERIGT